MRRVTTIWDLIGSTRQPMVLEEFENTYNVQTNFLEYGVVCRKVRDFLEWKDKPDYNPVAPYKCMLNIVLSIDTKEVSNTYELLLGRNISIIEKACDNWNEKLTSELETFSVKKSFSRISMFVDLYLRYIQFRTLHQRFLINNILFKMKKKTSTLCDFCHTIEDSNEHMLFHCGVVKKIWRDLEQWILDIGVFEYIIDEKTIILGEWQKSALAQCYYFNCKEDNC